MFHLTQYIVVRRDLPLDDIMPQACHGAGKASFWSGYQVGLRSATSFKEQEVTPDWGHPTRILKGARNEKKLIALSLKLQKLQIPHVTVTEPEGELKGQMTSLSLLPGDKETLAPLLNDFQNLRYSAIAAFAALTDALMGAVEVLEQVQSVFDLEGRPFGTNLSNAIKAGITALHGVGCKTMREQDVETVHDDHSAR
jgi:hypothetical protein